MIEPHDFSGERGQNATLICKIDGNPSPTYAWFKNDDPQTVSFETTLYLKESFISIFNLTLKLLFEFQNISNTHCHVWSNLEYIHNRIWAVIRFECGNK